MQVHNTYWVLRHGRSKANEAGIIVSEPHNGAKPEKQLAQQLALLGVPPEAVHVYSSPFSRTLETAACAALAAAAAGFELPVPQPTPLLAERRFGLTLELSSHNNYNPCWQHDARDPETHGPHGDSESVAEVAARARQLFQELEARHQGQHVVLVSHGDTLSILQAAFHGTPLAQHRAYGLGTAELKALNGAPAAAAVAPAVVSA